MDEKGQDVTSPLSEQEAEAGDVGVRKENDKGCLTPPSQPRVEEDIHSPQC